MKCALSWKTASGKRALKMQVDDSSKLYRPISKAEVQRLCDIHFPHVQMTKIMLEPVNQQLLLPFERNAIHSAVLAAEMMRLHGVPTARVLASDTAGENIGRANGCAFLGTQYRPMDTGSGVVAGDDSDDCACSDRIESGAWYAERRQHAEDYLEQNG